jgi:hypothetical protein
LTASLREYTWTPPATLLWPAAFAAATWLAYLSFDHRTARTRSRLASLWITLTASALSVLLAMTGSAKLGQLCGLFAAAMGVCTIVELWQPRFRLSAGGAPFIAAMMATFCLGGHYYSELPAIAAILLFVAPHMLWIAELPVIRHRGRAMRVAAEMMLIAIPVALAVWRAVATAPPEDTYYPY